ncbi:MAG TPA: hypothetical protein VKA12_10590, partial [Roseiarcus sp.]|nr:hypothetical protein [Roseiarcus sp.]
RFRKPPHFQRRSRLAGAARRRPPPRYPEQRRRGDAPDRADMQLKYEETSLGGLAVNFIEW